MKISGIKRQIHMLEHIIAHYTSELNDLREVLATVSEYKDLEEDKKRLLKMNQELLNRLSDPDAATPSPEIIRAYELPDIKALNDLRAGFIFGFDPGKDSD